MNQCGGRLLFIPARASLDDGYLLSHLDWTPGQTRRLHLRVPSPDLRGATPPLLAEVNIDARYVGQEEIQVQAGRFAARHSQYLDPGGGGFTSQHPPYDLWITDDADAVMLQGGVEGHMLTWYELIALERT